jgi:hypothetical protein
MTATAGLLAIVAYGHGDTLEFDRVAPARAVVDAHGNIHVPDGYRSTYEFLGSWAVAADESRGAKDLHVVYASPGAVSAYRRNRDFPDGAVLVKEVFAAATTSMTTGTVSRAETLKGWFIMVKDARGRYPGNKLWGDGWGWSWFDAGSSSKTTSSDYKVNCLACHIPAQSSDWIYVNGYPPLKSQR